MSRSRAVAIAALLGTATASWAADPPVHATAFALPHPGIPPTVMVAAMRAVETGLKHNPRLEVHDLDARLADFAQEIPQGKIDRARAASKDGSAALAARDVPRAVQLLQEAVEGLAEVLPYIKKQELADAMAALAVAYYEGGDTRAGRDQLVRLFTWRLDYVLAPERFAQKYILLFEEVHHEVERGRRGTLAITSEPTGAQAYVDGKYAGITPCAAEGLPVGDHFVTLKKEGYRKAVTRATASSRREERVAIRLVRSEKYLLVEQALEKIQTYLGAELGRAELEDLRQVLFIDHAVFVRVAQSGDNLRVDAFLYDTRTRRRLAHAFKLIDRRRVESELEPLVATLYLNVDYTPRLLVPEDAPPPAKPTRTPIYKAWWLWAATAAVVGGAVATGFVIAETAPPSCPYGAACLRVAQ